MKKSCLFGLLLLISIVLGAQNATLPSKPSTKEVKNINPVSNPKGWRVHIDFEGQIYSSYILGVQGNSFESAKKLQSSEYVGDVYGMVGVIFEHPPINKQVIVTVEATKYSKKASETITITQKLSTLAIFPKITWDYDLLRSNKQATPIDFTVNVSIDGKVSSQIATANLRAIDDCPLWSRDYRGDTVDLRIIFAAFVNEGSQQVKDLLTEVRANTVVKEFVGLQKGEEIVLTQLYAIWQTLRKKKFSYSSILKNGQNIDANGRIISQRVRLFEDVCKDHMFNCIDISAFMSSILEAIDIPSAIVLVPEHAFLGFYLTKEKDRPLFLETTMLGGETESLPKEILADNGVKGLSKLLYGKFAKGVKGRDKEIDHFIYALLSGLSTYESNKVGGNATLIDIGETRSLVKPIYRENTATARTEGDQDTRTKKSEPDPSAFKFLYQGKSTIDFEQQGRIFSSTATKKNGYYFKVHVDFFTRATDFQNYDCIKKFGRLDIEWAPDRQYYRLLIGDFLNIESAKRAAWGLRRLGYKHTAVVHYSYGNRVEIIALEH